jgi:hypothetical protein
VRGTVATAFCALVAASSSASVAQQVINGAIPTPLNATGVTSGVSITGQGGGGTLIVGTVGGPQMISSRTIRAAGS